MKDIYGTEYNLEDFSINYNKKNKIIIFGAGKYGLHIYETIQTKGLAIEALCDNNRGTLDNLKDRYPVKYSDEIIEEDLSAYFIIGISRLAIVKIIKKQLMDMGVKPNQMVIPLPDEHSGFFDNRIMIDEEYCILAIREMWQAVRRKNDNHIVDYFETNDLLNVCVYEQDLVSGWLDEDLRGTKVKIINKLKAVEDFKDDGSCDAIVIMNEPSYELMEEELMKISNIPIISIWDVLKY